MTIDRNDYERICALADAASDLPAAERESHLQVACGDDAVLLDRVRRHLTALLRNQTDPLLVEPPHEPTAALPDVDTEAATIDVQDTEAITASTTGPAHEPHQLGEFQIRRTLGAGGMGQVCLAHHSKLHRLVAIKSVHRHLLSQTALRERFLREAQAAARLQHPHIVSVYELGTAGDVDFIVMEYIEGQDLEASGRQTTRTAAEHALQIADAVQYAHEQGVVHRDLKPSNILLDRSYRPHVTDFGLAMLLDADHRLTVDDAILGTPSYMAPEQADPKQGVGPSADIYAVGGILYFMLTGKPPFRAATHVETLRLVMQKEAKFPSQSAEIPRDLKTICLKCLHKSPGRRYPTARALAEDLQAYLDGRPITARRVTSTERVWMWVKRHPAASLCLTLCALIALALPLLRSKFQSLDKKTAEAVAAADEQTQAAAESESRAQVAESQVQQERYADLIQQAHEQLLLGNRRTANDLLDLCEEDDRCWVWHYLKNESSASTLLTSMGSCSSITVTPDGAWAIAAFAGRILGWETDTRTRVLQITPEQNATAIDLAASSQNTLAGLFQDSIQCWDLLTGERVASWPLDSAFDFQHPGRIQFDHDGQSLFVARKNRLSVWDPISERRRWDIETGPTIEHLAVSPDDLLVAVSGSDKDGPVVQVFDASLGEPLETIRAESKILGVQLSLTAAKNALVAILHEDRLRFHTLELPANNISGAQPRMPDPAESIREIEQRGALCLANGSHRQIVVGTSQGLRIYDPMHRRRTHDLRGGSVAHATISRKLVGVARDEINRPHLWRPRGTHGVPEQLGLLYGDFDGSLRRFATTSLGRFHWALLDAKEPHDYQLSQDPPFIYVGRTHGRKASMKTWQPAGPSPQVAIALAPDGHTIAAADRYLRVWSLPVDDPSANDTPWKHDLEANANGMAISKDGELLAVSTDANVQLWDLEQHKLLRSFDESGGFALSFSPDRSQLAVTHHIRTIMADIGASAQQKQKLDVAIVTVFDLASGERTHAMKAANVFDVPSCVTFSPDGSQLCAGLCSGIARTWDLASGELLDDVRVGESVCLGVTFSPDSRRLATASVDEVLIWDVATRRRLLALSFDSGMTKETAGYGQIVVPPTVMAAWGNKSRELEETPAIVWTNAGRSQLQFSEDGKQLGFWSPFGRHFWSAEMYAAPTQSAPNNPFLNPSNSISHGGTDAGRNTGD